MIEKFRGIYNFLSNFYECDVYYKNIKFPSVEHAYQAAKSSDENIRLKISTMSASEAKKFAKTIKLRDDWNNDLKVNIMYELLLQKFYYNTILRLNLEVLTENQYIEEGNWWHDNFWGIRKCEKCLNEKGENILGKLLMKIRDEDISRIKNLNKEEFEKLLKETR